MVNIKPTEFHLVQLCSFCNIYMSNDVKFFETPFYQYIFFVRIEMKIKHATNLFLNSKKKLRNMDMNVMHNNRKLV